MKSLTYLIAYTMSLAPVAALTLYISDTASAQIISSFEEVIDMLQTLNASLI